MLPVAGGTDLQCYLPHCICGGLELSHFKHDFRLSLFQAPSVYEGIAAGNLAYEHKVKISLSFVNLELTHVILNEGTTHIESLRTFW